MTSEMETSDYCPWEVVNLCFLLGITIIERTASMDISQDSDFGLVLSLGFSSLNKKMIR